jgi:predicted metal-binding protein
MPGMKNNFFGGTMSDINKIIQDALDIGFSVAIPLNVSEIKLLPVVRDMCAENKCGRYGKNWTCPPACGTLEDCAADIRSFKHGIIAETIGDLEDSFDFDGIREVSKKHNALLKAFAEKLRSEYPDVLVLGAGGCTVCKECAYPEPCRHPDQAHSSMEAYGMMVNDVCKSNGAPYYPGPNKQAFFSCFFVDRENDDEA